MNTTNSKSVTGGNQLTLNCDLGESFGAWQMGNDADIMPYIDCANIACGFHAGDPCTMSNTIKLATLHNVTIGAHPGYPDKEGFGRRSMAFENQSLTAAILYQVGALQAICQHYHTSVAYIKPHGALYNDMMANIAIFESIALAAQTLALPLMIQALPSVALENYHHISQTLGITLIYEAFADRNYLASGKLVARSQSNALILDPIATVNRCEIIMTQGEISTIDNTKLQLNVDSLCVHGDTPKAIAIVKALREFIDHTYQLQ